MERDMELIRKILFAIEEKYVDTWLHNSKIQIDGYDMKTIGYHCAIMFEAGLINDYKAQYANNELWSFGVGRLTWDGHELLDKIKNDNVWIKTKNIIIKQGLPFVLGTVKDVATAITTAMIKSAITEL